MTSTHPHADVPSAGAGTTSLGQWARRLGRPGIVIATTAVAVVANVALWAVGALAGGTFEFTDAGVTQSAAPGGVIVLTLVPVAVGMTLAALVARWPVLVRIAQVVGPLIALATIGGTLAADFDGPSTVALSLAHVVIAIVLVIGLGLLVSPPARPNTGS